MSPDGVPDVQLPKFLAYLSTLRAQLEVLFELQDKRGVALRNAQALPEYKRKIDFLSDLVDKRKLADQRQSSVVEAVWAVPDASGGTAAQAEAAVGDGRLASTRRFLEMDARLRAIQRVQKEQRQELLGKGRERKLAKRVELESPPPAAPIALAWEEQEAQEQEEDLVSQLPPSRERRAMEEESTLASSWLQDAEVRRRARKRGEDRHAKASRTSRKRRQEAIVAEEKELQEQLASEINEMVGSLRNNVQALHSGLQADAAVVEELDASIEDNVARVQRENERLKELLKTMSRSTWMIWGILLLVWIIFIGMYVFMKIFSKPR